MEAEEGSPMQNRLKYHRTAPFDPRFPQVNQTRHCFQEYLDFFRCEKVLGDKGKDVSQCEWFKKNYESLCPKDWTELWDEQREEGTFPAKI